MTDITTIEAEVAAARTLAGCDTSIDWKDAGYATTAEAAAAMVGDTGDAVVTEMAVRIVADVLTGEVTK